MNPTQLLARREDATESLERHPDHGEALFGRYQLGERLGSGGFGIVWRARDLNLGRDVAVKEVSGLNQGSRRQRRAKQEAEAAARLNHPNIVTLYEYIEDGDQAYLVSELVEGRTLDQLLAGGELSDREIADIGAQVAAALAAAHKAGVIHRDIKPQNIIVSESLDESSELLLGQAKLMDFGVAHVAQEGGVTATGDVIGTLTYMAPEQAHGERANDSVDVYSLALTLYEAWAGTNPLRAATAAATLERIGTKIKPLGRMRRDLPEEICEQVDAGLAVVPELRPTAEELAETLADQGKSLEGEPLPPVRGSYEKGVPRLAKPAAKAAYSLTLAAGLVAAATVSGVAVPETPVAAAAIATGCLAYLLPRLTWLAVAACALAAVFISDQGGGGLALVVSAVLLPVPLLLLFHPRLWTLPAAAVGLAWLGIGPAYLGLAASVKSAWARLALGLLGLYWAVIAESIWQRALIVKAPDGLELRSFWAGSLTEAWQSALLPIFTVQTAALAAVWAAAALLIRIPLARGRTTAVFGLSIWATLVIAATNAVDQIGASSGLANLPGQVAGVVIAAAIVMLIKVASAGRSY